MQYLNDEAVRAVIDGLRERGLTVGFAESCTAGMISSRIADIAGSSDVLMGGIVSYSNSVKAGVLGVSAEVLQRYGAVSEQCAKEMAEGARRVLGCSVAVSVTGIAGPGGGTREKPVGTVCFGISDERGTVTDTLHFGEDRDRAAVRHLTTDTAIRMLAARIEE